MKLNIHHLRELLHYDPQTGHFSWKRTHGKMHQSLIGQRAGTVKPCNGYRTLQVAGCLCYEHRLAWFYVHSKWPPNTIDHINHDRADNRIANLRLATRAQNSANRVHKGNRLSGHVGIQFHPRDKLWRAYIMVNGRHKSLGYYKTPEDASVARAAAEIEMLGEFRP